MCCSNEPCAFKHELYHSLACLLCMVREAVLIKHSLQCACSWRGSFWCCAGTPARSTAPSGRLWTRTRDSETRRRKQLSLLCSSVLSSAWQPSSSASSACVGLTVLIFHCAAALASVSLFLVLCLLSAGTHPFTAVPNNLLYGHSGSCCLHCFCQCATVSGALSPSSWASPL